MAGSNPTFNDKTLTRMREAGVLGATESMTLDGTINKVGFLVVLTVLSSAFAWTIADSDLGAMLALGSIIGNLILALVIIYNKPMAAKLAIPYALIEGLALGFISYYANRKAPGVVSNAVIGTFAILFTMAGAYRMRWLQATERFVTCVTVATCAVALIYLVDIGLSFAGVNIPMIHQGGTVGILFSLAVIVIASLNFITDFAMIERAVEAKAPRYMEWYAGFAVLVTLVWLYLEVLRLLGKMSKK